VKVLRSQNIFTVRTLTSQRITKRILVTSPTQNKSNTEATELLKEHIKKTQTHKLLPTSLGCSLTARRLNHSVYSSFRFTNLWNLEKTLTKHPYTYLTLWMQHTLLTCYEQEDEHYEADLGKSFRSTNFTSCLNESWQPKGTARWGEQSTCAYKLTQSVLFSWLRNSVTQTQQLTGNNMIQPSCCLHV
jgi:hypothetical protein